MDREKLLKDFPMLHQSMQGHPLIYLDSAATSFKPWCVMDAVRKYDTEFTANAHRGDYDIAHQVDTIYDDARKVVAQFIHADKREIVFTSGTSMSLNFIAHGYALKFLGKDDEILLTEAEHASNVLPWFSVAKTTGCKIRYIPLTEEGRVTPENVEKSMNSHVKLVSIAHVTNVLGYVNDIEAIAKVVHKYGAVFSVDGAQSVPHFPTDVKKWDIDFLSFSGHKMCGPTGIGVLWGKYELLQKMDPLLSGGGMNARFDLCGDVRLLEAPFKFEAGTQNIEGVIGLSAAIRYLTEIGMENIHQHELELKKYAVEKLQALPNVILYNASAESGILTFNIRDVFAQDAATYLNSRGIAVRSGQHCAKILTNFLKTVATVRASFYFYNTKEEIDTFVEACRKAGDFLDAYFA